MHIALRSQYKILGFAPDISPEFQQKLLLQGLRPGSSFRVTAAAPFGGPVKIENRYAVLALRREDLSHLQLEQLNG